MADYTQKYGEIYKKVLAATMAQDTPFAKFAKQIDEYFEKYGVSNDRRFEMLCNTLVSMTQSVTTTSQEISLRLLSESEELPKKLAQADKQLELTQKQIETENLKIDLQKQRIPLEIEQLRLQKDALQAQIDKSKADALLAGQQQKAIERQVKDNRLIKGASVLGDFLQNTLNGGLNVPSGMNQALFNILATLIKDDGVPPIAQGDYNIKK